MSCWVWAGLCTVYERILIIKQQLPAHLSILAGRMACAALWFQLLQQEAGGDGRIRHADGGPAANLGFLSHLCRSCDKMLTDLRPLIEMKAGAAPCADGDPMEDNNHKPTPTMLLPQTWARNNTLSERVSE